MFMDYIEEEISLTLIEHFNAKIGEDEEKDFFHQYDDKSTWF